MNDHGRQRATGNRQQPGNRQKATGNRPGPTVALFAAVAPGKQRRGRAGHSNQPNRFRWVR